MSIFKKFATIGGLTIVSRLLGVVRESILVHFIGASIEMDVFTTAYKFPSFFRKFFAEGGFQSIFIPYYTDFTNNKKNKGASYFTAKILFLLSALMLFVTVFVIIFAKQFTLIMAPGFKDDPTKLDLAIKFTRIIFPSIFFVSISTIYSGILLAKKRLVQYAVAPILVNIILILSLVMFSRITTAGYAISIGVLLAGVFQFLYMYINVKKIESSPSKITTLRPTKTIKNFSKKLMPVLAGAGVSQINVLISTVFASYLPTGCITYLYCADRFIQLPIALFGIVIGIIILTEIANQNNKTQVVEIQQRTAIFALRLSLPIIVLLATLSSLIISILYGHGKFTQDSVYKTAYVVTISSIGLPSYIMARIFTSAQFAQKDTLTTTKAAIISICSNALVSIILIGPLQTNGLAIANVVAGYINIFILTRKYKELYRLAKTEMSALKKILLATTIMTTAILFCLHSYKIQTENTISELLAVACISALGITIYIITLCFSNDEPTKNIILRYAKKTIINK
ncbi:MAG: murein biosynthesis integral membrane protein MurJ [Alphaproteobacteria bacterium]|nr:murein biosynthesis integral membrane protein MurJ [Alphaproteobacteria bacterium]